MKNVNLTMLLTGLATKFGVNDYCVNHLMSTDSNEPMDMLINVMSVNRGELEIEIVETFVKSCIIGDVKQTGVTLKGSRGRFEIYIEFMNSEFKEQL